MECVRFVSIMQIVTYPHPCLRCKSIEVKPSVEVDKLIETMFAAMYAAKGLGLAANQLGYPWQIIVMNPTHNPVQKNKELVFCNPKIIKTGNRYTTGIEGCLSLPELFRQVTRPSSVYFEAMLPTGEIIKREYAGLLGRCFQHEFDHLQGVLFIDKLVDKQCEGVNDYLSILTGRSSKELLQEQTEQMNKLRGNNA